MNGKREEQNIGAGLCIIPAAFHEIFFLPAAVWCMRECAPRMQKYRTRNKIRTQSGAVANACSIIIIISLFLISLIKALDKAEAPHTHTYTHTGVERESRQQCALAHSRVMTFSYNELVGCHIASALRGWMLIPRPFFRITRA
jgi:hypothetical protein